MSDRLERSRFLCARHGNTLRYVRDDVVAELSARGGGEAISDPWALPWSVEGRIEGGRRSVEIRALPGSSLRVVAKTLTRGGVLGRILQGLAARERVDREIAIADRLLARSVPAVELLALRATFVLPGLPLVRIDYLTAAIDDASDGERSVRTCSDPALRRQMFQRAGAAVRAMHDAGIDHVDLNVRNLIVDGRGMVRVLDFGASHIRDPLPHATAVANLARLWRSCVKRGLDGSGALRRSEVLRFLRGYSQTEAKSLWQEVDRRFRRDVGFHRIAWRLFGRG